MSEEHYSQEHSQHLRLGVWCLGFGGLVFGVWCLSLGFRVQGLEFEVWGSGLEV